MVSLQDDYVQEVEQKLLITEYNPSPLVNDSTNIQITCDGAPLENIKSKVKQVTNEYVEQGETGWYQYEYEIDTSNFEKDGLYKLFVSSEDTAGNKPEITNELGYDVTFHVDTAKPEISNIIGLEKVTKAPDEDLTVKFDIFDAIGLKNVKAYINGEEVTIESADKVDGSMNYHGEFGLNEKGKQYVQLVVEDLAGNITDTASNFNPGYVFNDEITVTDSEIVRMLVEWYNASWFWGSIAGIAVVITGSTTAGIILYRRRKLKNK